MRYQTFDSFRGFALVLMAIYHFSFDLNHFEVIHQAMNWDPFWLWFRVIIMTSFTGLVGISLSLGQASYQSKSYRRRMTHLFLCAGLISIGTYFVFPETWTFFGVIHFIFVASLIGPSFIRHPNLSLLLGLILVALPAFYRDLFFQQKLLIITGLSPLKPITEDFSPLTPWLGVVLIGVFIGDQVKRRNPGWAKVKINFLDRIGRHSLLFYMTHQLVLFPIAWGVSKII